MIKKLITSIILTIIMGIGYGQYCLPTYLNTCSTLGSFTNDFSFNTISNLGTGCASPSVNNYTDYTAISTNVTQGTAYTVTVAPGGSFEQYFAVFIDFNNDGDFDDPGEYFDVGYAAPGTTIASTINIPSGVTLGSKRLRVVGRYFSAITATQSCGSPFFGGETEDYTINILPSYCLPTYNNQCTSFDFINDFTFNTISNLGTGCASPSVNNYTDYTAISTNITQGTAYTVTVAPGPLLDQSFAVFIDFNNDFDFDDAGEFFDIGYAAPGATISNTINIPTGLTSGAKRLRVVSRFFGVVAATESCGSLNFGETEDYTINILPSTPIEWTGTTDTDWNTASNWSTGTVPTAIDEVIIPTTPSGNASNFPIISSAVTLGETTVDAGASLAVNTGITLDGTFTNNGTVTLNDGAYLDDYSSGTGSYVGDITVERFVSNGSGGNDQRFISSAVNNPNISEIGDDLVGPWGTGLPGTDGVAVTIDDCALQTTTPSSNYGNLFEFDESLINTCELDGWVVRSTGNIENGKGYSAYLPSGSTFEMSGTPNSNDVIIPVTNSGSGVAAGEGWNLIGNPYPSPISRDDVIAAGVTDAQYYEASGPYQGTFTPYTPTSNIAIAQGFQVQTAATGTITLTDAMRNTGANTWYSNSSWFTHKLEVIVSGNSFADKAIVFYNDEATNNYEAMYDVRKRASALGQPTLSSFGANEKLALNGMSVNTLGETVPLHFDAGTDGSFTLSFEGAETFPANTTIYVKDLQENILHSVADGDYTFVSNTADNAERFEIIFIPEVNFTTVNVDCDLNKGGLVLKTLNNTSDRTFEILDNNTVVNAGSLADLNTVELAEGNYTLKVLDQYGGSQSYDVEILNAELIEANFEVSNTEILLGEMISLNNTTTNSTDVNWTILNSDISDVNNLTYVFEEAGTYEVEMTVSNEECSDSKSVFITVLNKTTSIQSINGEEISVYPNPTSDVLHIDFNREISVKIIDFVGRTVIQTTNKSIDMSDVTSGIYLVEIYDLDNKLIVSEKIVKK